MSGARLGAGALVRDFLGFARGRSAAAIGLIVAGALLEGAGIIMLVPIVSLILRTDSAEDAGMIASAFAWLGIEDGRTRLAVALFAFACLLGVRFAVLMWRDGLLARLQAEFVADLRSRTFRHLARASWAEVAGVRQAPIGHALTRDVDRAAGGVTAMIQAGVAGVMLAVQFGLAMLLAPLVSLAAAALGLGLLRGLRGLRDRAARRGRALTGSDLALFESVGGFLRGLKPAKAHGLESQYVAAFEASARRVADEYRAFTVEISIARLILQTAAGLTGIMVTLLGLFVIGTPPERLIVTLIILARLYTPLQVMQNTAQIVRHAAEGYRLARELAGPVGRVEPPRAPLPAAPLSTPPEIALLEVTVAGGPAAARPLLERVTAVLPAGAVTVLIGESGAGKSTFCDLAVGLLAPDAGEVQVDGRPLQGELIGRLRASLAYVGQEPFLFEDSLRGNLCWGCGPVDDAAIWRALEIVGATGLARGLEGGLDGPIRAEGMRFSGGERQRLRLARALLRRPRLLVLDEATSALDLAAEAEVLRAVLAARDGATVLMVSHRPATLRLAEHVIVLEDGRLSEAGPVGVLAGRAQSRVRAVLGGSGGEVDGRAVQK